ncbi:MAG: hypothetical protein WA821_07695 [Anaerolineales bacterium]
MKNNILHPWLTRLLRQLIPNIGTVLVVAALLFANNVRAASLSAASPNTISYQGTLSTVSGTAVTGSVGITFSLYNVPSGVTAPLWTEPHTGANVVPVNNGLFNVLLGSITPIPSAVWDNAPVYLGVQVAGDSAELSPREVVSAVPYAMNAAGTIVIPDGSITTPKIAVGAITRDKLASGAASKITMLDQPIQIVNEWGGATSGRTLDLSASVPVTAQSVLVEINAGGADVRACLKTPGATYESLCVQESTGGTSFGQGWVKMSNRTIYYWTSMSPSSQMMWIIGYMEQ